MFTVTLTAPKDRLDPALVDALRNAWGGGDAVWLSPGEAAEFPVMHRPDTFDTARADVDAQGADLNIQPTGHRRRKLLIADMDSTMIGQECIDELADEAGVGPRVAEITARAMNGELDFEAALAERLALLKGLETSVIDRVLAERITLAPGGRTLVATMKANGARCVLVSGGFTAFADRIGKALGFDVVKANRLNSVGGQLTGTAAKPILGRAAKLETLRDECARAGIGPEEAVAVGDGANDLAMIGAAGMGVAVHAKPAVQVEAPFRVNHGDLTAVLFLQGYSVADFDHAAPDAEDFAV